jgi:hypothetical protein
LQFSQSVLTEKAGKSCYSSVNGSRGGSRGPPFSEKEKSGLQIAVMGIDILMPWLEGILKGVVFLGAK